jgi:hypothetical protein
MPLVEDTVIAGTDAGGASENHTEPCPFDSGCQRWIQATISSQLDSVCAEMSVISGTVSELREVFLSKKDPLIPTDLAMHVTSATGIPKAFSSAWISSASLEYSSFNFASLNCAGLAGKRDLLLSMLDEHCLDFIFLSETWCKRGGTSRLFSDTILIHEHNLISNGRAHYGEAILLNGNRCSAKDFTIILADKSRHLFIFSYCGVRFICIYIKPMAPREQFLALLDSLMEYTLIDEPIIFVGDLNARLLNFDDHAGNVYGRVTVIYEFNEPFHGNDLSHGRFLGKVLCDTGPQLA